MAHCFRALIATSAVIAGLTGVIGVTTISAQTRYDPGKGALTRPVPAQPPDPLDHSHSAHGQAFDQGPRQQAHLLHQIGNVHFPITTANPLAQRFFDQGVNLFYSFSWYESERAFRQAAMLDPGCAMAYWGLAMADTNRGKEFIALAQAREAKVTDRERRYIDALAINFRGGDDKSRQADNIRALEQLTIAYPKDIEAKAILAWALKDAQRDGITFRTAIDALLREVLAVNPLHPGANHYRIHLWDGVDAAQALDSCLAFAKAAPAIGHAQHMPGHIYSHLGRYEEAVHAMDTAARDERRYCYDQNELPFESWDYLHNQDFLIGNIGYVGRIEEGIHEARELLEVPRDPQFDVYGTANTGRFDLMRMRVRGERWDEILADKNEGWSDSPNDQGWLLYERGLAFLGKGDRESARKASAAFEKLKTGGSELECARLELSGLLAVADGNPDVGIASLRKAVATETANFAIGDPIPYPRPVYETLADACLIAEKPADAEAAVREGLKREPQNGFGVALLCEALVAEGKRAEAVTEYAHLKQYWAHADTDLPALHRVLALHLDSAQGDGAWKPTPYRASPELARFGPADWSPFPAAEFTLQDPAGKSVHLSDFRGRNLLIIYYLGGACPNCTHQLELIGKEKAAFAALGGDVIAVSSDTPAMNSTFLATAPNYPLRLLSDHDHEAARHYKAYDEFEKLELHAVLLVDREGRVWWFRSGSEPFTDIAFLKSEMQRMNDWQAAHPTTGTVLTVAH